MAPGAPPNPTKQPLPPLPRYEKRIALTRHFVGFHKGIGIGLKLGLSRCFDPLRASAEDWLLNAAKLNPNAGGQSVWARGVW